MCLYLIVFCFSISMVVLWTCGDVFKTTYFFLRAAPLQFWICGMLQVTIDLLILMQVYIYRCNPEPQRVRSRRGDWVVIIWTHDIEEGKTTQQEQRDSMSSSNGITDAASVPEERVRFLSCRDDDYYFRRPDVVANHAAIATAAKAETDPQLQMELCAPAEIDCNEDSVIEVNVQVHAESEEHFTANHTANGTATMVEVRKPTGHRVHDVNSGNNFNNNNNNIAPIMRKKPPNHVSVLIHRHTLWRVSISSVIHHKVIFNRLYTFTRAQLYLLLYFNCSF